jgi:hypothetical protein
MVLRMRAIRNHLDGIFPLSGDCDSLKMQRELTAPPGDVAQITDQNGLNS